MQYVYALIRNIPKVEGNISLMWVGPEKECGICLGCKLNRGKNIYLGFKMGTNLLLLWIDIQVQWQFLASVEYCIVYHVEIGQKVKKTRMELLSAVVPPI